MTGAVRPERIVSAMMPARTRKPPPNFLRVVAMGQQHDKGEQLWAAISIPIVPTNTHAARIGSCAGHCGNSENPFGKYSGRTNCACSETRIPNTRKIEPERRGEIGSDSRQADEAAKPSEGRVPEAPPDVADCPDTIACRARQNPSSDGGHSS